MFYSFQDIVDFCLIVLEQLCCVRSRGSSLPIGTSRARQLLSLRESRRGTSRPGGYEARGLENFDWKSLVDPNFVYNKLVHCDNWKDNFRYQHPFINPTGMQACTWMDPSPNMRHKDPAVDPDGAIGGARNQPFWGANHAYGCSGKQNEPNWHFQHFWHVTTSMFYMIAMQ